MLKVVTAPLGKSRNSKRKLGSKRVAGPDGRKITLWTVDADDENFGETLELAFRRNVKRLRQENMRLLGKPDFEPAAR